MKNKEKIMSALLSSGSQTEAAEKCGISDRTIRTYLDDPVFYEEYQRRKRELVTTATRQLQASYSAAIKSLTSIIEEPLGINPSVRISAARVLLEYGLKFTEQSEIIGRLDDIERRLNDNKASG